MEDWEKFVSDGERLLRVLDGLPDRAADFVSSVRDRVEGMIEWARDNEHVTDRMEDALANMRDGAARWLQY